MTPAPVHYSGRAHNTRTQAGRKITMWHDSEMVLERDRAVLRYTSLDTGDSAAIPITDRGAVYALQQADELMVRTARRSEEVETFFKPDRSTEADDDFAPPAGWRWCPACLGCHELAPVCDVCDGDRIVRDSVDAE